MRTPKWEPSRVSVVRRLQAIAAACSPGTEMFEIADRAVDLAMSNSRSEANPALFFRNVWRNARFIVRRKRPRELIFDSMHEDSPIGSRIANGELRNLAGPATPEEISIATDLEVRIRFEAGQVDALGAECFDGLVAGQTLDETARTLSISTRRVRQARERIRAAARRVISYDRVAA